MPDDAATVAALLTPADGWAVDQHVGYDGLCTIVAVHEPSGLTYALSGPSTRVELAKIESERFQSCGTFDAIDAAVEVLLKEAVVHGPDCGGSGSSRC